MPQHYEFDSDYLESDRSPFSPPNNLTIDDVLHQCINDAISRPNENTIEEFVYSPHRDGASEIDIYVGVRPEDPDSSPRTCTVEMGDSIWHFDTQPTAEEFQPISDLITTNSPLGYFNDIRQDVVQPNDEAPCNPDTIDRLLGELTPEEQQGMNAIEAVRGEVNQLVQDYAVGYDEEHPNQDNYDKFCAHLEQQDVACCQVIDIFQGKAVEQMSAIRDTVNGMDTNFHDLDADGNALETYHNFDTLLEQISDLKDTAKDLDTAIDMHETARSWFNPVQCYTPDGDVYTAYDPEMIYSSRNTAFRHTIQDFSRNFEETERPCDIKADILAERLYGKESTYDSLESRVESVTKDFSHLVHSPDSILFTHEDIMKGSFDPTDKGYADKVSATIDAYNAVHPDEPIFSKVEGKIGLYTDAQSEYPLGVLSDSNRLYVDNKNSYLYNDSYRDATQTLVNAGRHDYTQDDVEKGYRGPMHAGRDNPYNSALLTTRGHIHLDGLGCDYGKNDIVLFLWNRDDAATVDRESLCKDLKDFSEMKGEYWEKVCADCDEQLEHLRTVMYIDGADFHLTPEEANRFTEDECSLHYDPERDVCYVPAYDTLMREKILDGTIDVNKYWDYKVPEMLGSRDRVWQYLQVTPAEERQIFYDPHENVDQPNAEPDAVDKQEDATMEVSSSEGVAATEQQEESKIEAESSDTVESSHPSQSVESSPKTPIESQLSSDLESAQQKVKELAQEDSADKVESPSASDSVEQKQTEEKSVEAPNPSNYVEHVLGHDVDKEPVRESSADQDSQKQNQFDQSPSSRHVDSDSAHRDATDKDAQAHSHSRADSVDSDSHRSSHPMYQKDFRVAFDRGKAEKLIRDPSKIELSHAKKDDIESKVKEQKVDAERHGQSFDVDKVRTDLTTEAKQEIAEKLKVVIDQAETIDKTGVEKNYVLGRPAAANANEIGIGLSADIVRDTNLSKQDSPFSHAFSEQDTKAAHSQSILINPWNDAIEKIGQNRLEDAISKESLSMKSGLEAKLSDLREAYQDVDKYDFLKSDAFPSVASNENAFDTIPPDYKFDGQSGRDMRTAVNLEHAAWTPDDLEGHLAESKDTPEGRANAFEKQQAVISGVEKIEQDYKEGNILDLDKDNHDLRNAIADYQAAGGRLGKDEFLHNHVDITSEHSQDSKDNLSGKVSIDHQDFRSVVDIDKARDFVSGKISDMLSNDQKALELQQAHIEVQKHPEEYTKDGNINPTAYRACVAKEYTLRCGAANEMLKEKLQDVIQDYDKMDAKTANISQFDYRTDVEALSSKGFRDLFVARSMGLDVGQDSALKTDISQFDVRASRIEVEKTDVVSTGLTIGIDFILDHLPSSFKDKVDKGARDLEQYRNDIEHRVDDKTETQDTSSHLETSDSKSVVDRVVSTIKTACTVVVDAVHELRDVIKDNSKDSIEHLSSSDVEARAQDGSPLEREDAIGEDGSKDDVTSDHTFSPEDITTDSTNDNAEESSSGQVESSEADSSMESVSKMISDYLGNHGEGNVSGEDIAKAMENLSPTEVSDLMSDLVDHANDSEETKDLIETIGTHAEDIFDNGMSDFSDSLIKLGASEKDVESIVSKLCDIFASTVDSVASFGDTKVTQDDNGHPQISQEEFIPSSDSVEKDSEPNLADVEMDTKENQVVCDLTESPVVTREFIDARGNVVVDSLQASVHAVVQDNPDVVKEDGELDKSAIEDKVAEYGSSSDHVEESPQDDIDQMSDDVASSEDNDVDSSFEGETADIELDNSEPSSVEAFQDESDLVSSAISKD